MTRRRLLAVLMLPLVLVAAGCSSLTGTNAGGYITGDGQITAWGPDDRGTPIELSGDTLDGTKVDIADYRGKPVVVNVWWSGCGPCRTEMPLLQQTSTELAGTATFVGINTRDNSADNGLAFERSVGASYPSIYSPDGRALLAIPGLDRTLPQTIVLDRQGRVSAMVSGPLTSRTTLTDLVECAASDKAQHCEVGT